MKSTHQSNIKGENKSPVKVPSSVQKGARGERKYVRSMIGVPSNTVGVQAELDPTMTLRQLKKAPLPTIAPNHIRVVVKMEESEKFDGDGQHMLRLSGPCSLPDEFASMDLNQSKRLSLTECTELSTAGRRQICHE